VSSKKTAGPLRTFWRDAKGYPHRGDNHRLMKEAATVGLELVAPPPPREPRAPRATTQGAGGGAPSSAPATGPAELAPPAPAAPPAPPTTPPDPSAPEALPPPAEPVELEPAPSAPAVPPPAPALGTGAPRFVVPDPPEGELPEEMEPPPPGGGGSLGGGLGPSIGSVGSGGEGRHHPMCPNAGDDLVTCECCGAEFAVVSEEFAGFCAAFIEDGLSMGIQALVYKQTGVQPAPRDFSERHHSKLTLATQKFLAKVAPRQIGKIEAYAGLGLVAFTMGTIHYRDAMREARARAVAIARAEREHEERAAAQTSPRAAATPPGSGNGATPVKGPAKPPARPSSSSVRLYGEDA